MHANSRKMTLEEIDQELSAWRSKLAAANSNLLELGLLPTYKRLKGEDGNPPAPLSGATLAQVGPAFEAFDELLTYCGLLGAMIDRASQLRNSLSKWWTSDETVSEIEPLLHGASIELPAVSTPLASRMLLSAAESSEHVSPEKLLAMMAERFDLARAVVLSVDAAWNRLEAEVAACDQEAAALQDLAQDLGEPGSAEVAAARRQLAQLAQSVASDPLGAAAGLDRDVRGILTRSRAELDRLAGERDQVRQALNRGKRLLAELKDAHAECEGALTECKAEIEDPSNLREPLPRSEIDDLARWLATLEAKITERSWRPARVGLERWTRTVQSHLAAERAAAASNRAALALRAELRGRLSSFRAKTKAYAERGRAPSPQLQALAQAADDALHRKPTPLKEAVGLMRQYESALKDFFKAK